MKSKFRSAKSKKNKHKNCSIKQNEKKKMLKDVCDMTFKYLFTYFTHTYL